MNFLLDKSKGARGTMMDVVKRTLVRSFLATETDVRQAKSTATVDRKESVTESGTLD